jgi:hypothetical protein
MDVSTAISQRSSVRAYLKAVEEANGKVYNFSHGKPDRIKGLRKEVQDGAI